MSQIDSRITAFLSRSPEIEKCYRAGLVNRRALARYLIQQRAATPEQFDAVIGALRRHEFGPRLRRGRNLFHEVRIGLKDKIVIWDFERDRAFLERLERLIARIDYDRGDTLKVVVGTTSVKLFLDRRKEREVQPLFERSRIRHRYDHISEISLTFPDEATDTPGVVSTLTQELAVHDVVVTELLTASPELLLYLDDARVMTAYEVVRALRDAPDVAERKPSPG